MRLKLDPIFDVNPDELLDAGNFIKLPASDPFLHIARDPKKLLLTRLIASGKSTKTIAQVLNNSESEIEMFRKKMIHDTLCQNMVEYIAKAKDKHII